MSTLFIREYSNLGLNGNAPVAMEPGNNDQTPITLSGASQQSAAFKEATRFIGITSDGIFSYLVGSSPTVTTSHFRVPAGTAVFMGVKAGDKIAVITNT